MNGDENRKGEYQLPSIRSLTDIPTSSPQTSSSARPPQTYASPPPVAQQQQQQQVQSYERHYPPPPPLSQRYAPQASTPPNHQLSHSGSSHSHIHPQPSQSATQEYSYTRSPAQHGYAQQQQQYHSPQAQSPYHPSAPYATTSQLPYAYPRPAGAHAESVQPPPPPPQQQPSHPRHTPETGYDRDLGMPADPAPYYYRHHPQPHPQQQQSHAEYGHYPGPPPHPYSGEPPQMSPGAASSGGGGSGPSGMARAYPQMSPADHPSPLPPPPHMPPRSYQQQHAILAKTHVPPHPHAAYAHGGSSSTPALQSPQSHALNHPVHYQQPQAYPTYGGAGPRGSVSMHDDVTVMPAPAKSSATAPARPISPKRQPKPTPAKRGRAPSGIPAISSGSSTRQPSLSVPAPVTAAPVARGMHAEKPMQGAVAGAGALLDDEHGSEAHEALIKRRKRNAQSAARLRERRKNREQELSTSCTKLEGQIARLEDELKEEKQRAVSDRKRSMPTTQSTANPDSSMSAQEDQQKGRGAKRLRADDVGDDDGDAAQGSDNSGSDKEEEESALLRKSCRPLRELDQVRLDDLRTKIETLGKLNQQVCVNLGMLRQEIQRISEAIISQKDKQRQ
ncbi:hypothetical protein GQ54DRAFT_307549 [Martensiomyces pterosporus]|nr:hypothetical protein GQ54DRAFT_307549 [Martensiomyces pterosporus]